MTNGRHFGAGRARQVKEWTFIPSISLDLTAAGTSLGGSIGFVEARTVLRCRGELVITSEAGTNGDEALIVAALAVVSSDAFAAGAGSVPDPGAEGEYPWLWWRSVPIFVEGNDYDSAGAARVMVDTKAMRKMKPRESLAWVVQYVDVSGTPPMKVMIAHTRVLLGH